MKTEFKKMYIGDVNSFAHFFDRWISKKDYYDGINLIFTVLDDSPVGKVTKIGGDPESPSVFGTYQIEQFCSEGHTVIQGMKEIGHLEFQKGKNGIACNAITYEEQWRQSSIAKLSAKAFSRIMSECTSIKALLEAFLVDDTSYSIVRFSKQARVGLLWYCDKEEYKLSHPEDVSEETKLPE